MECIIWWWNFIWREGWTPLLIAKFGWSVKIRSIYDDYELERKWVGSEINCCKPCIVVRDSICVPSWDVNIFRPPWYKSSIKIAWCNCKRRSELFDMIQKFINLRQKLTKLSTRFIWWSICDNNISFLILECNFTNNGLCNERVINHF